jgi:hypothetical protein
MSISKVGSTTPTVTRTAAATVTPGWAGDMPRTAGNLLIAMVYAFGSNVIVGPGGIWTAVGTEVTTGSTIHLRAYYAIAAGADAAPAFTSTTASRMEASLSEWTGNSATPYVSACDGTATGTTSSITVTGGAAPTVADGLSIVSFGFRNGAAAVATETPGGGWTTNGFYGISDTSQAGQDYKLNPATGGGADSESLSISGPTITNAAAQYAFFAPSGGVVVNGRFLAFM